MSEMCPTAPQYFPMFSEKTHLSLGMDTGPLNQGVDKHNVTPTIDLCQYFRLSVLLVVTHEK